LIIDRLNLGYKGFSILVNKFIIMLFLKKKKAIARVDNNIITLDVGSV
jgi:hypothetical protein